MQNSTFLRYLEAKRTVDDRALNRTVLDVLRTRLSSPSLRKRPRVLEIGAGAATMVDRLWSMGILPKAEYTLTDQDGALLASGRERLSRLAIQKGLDTQIRSDGALELRGANVELTVVTKTLDLESFLALGGNDEQFDLVIACAVLDLVDVPSILPRLWSTLIVDGLFWFCINFDGETIFSPEHELDAPIMSLYHASMDNRMRDGRRSGDSRTGRRLFQHLAMSGARILASGSSDWVVRPVENAYPADEAFFLRHIVETIRSELSTHSEISADRLTAWTATRAAQIDHAELVYIAHQLDFVGFSPTTAASGNIDAGGTTATRRL